MSDYMTQELMDVLVYSARAEALRTQRSLEDVLVEWIHRTGADMPLETLPDDEILALSNISMDDQEQHDLSELLAAQREGVLDESGSAQLAVLMGFYRRGMVRKAHASQIAVERGLKPPLR